MFDAHIQYYAYNNTDGDDFGVGYIGNKEFWVGMVNRWAKEDHKQVKYTNEMFEEISPEDFRGCELAEVVPEDKEYVVSWDENSMRIDENGKISWENNPQNIPSVPRWISRLKNQLRDNEN